MEKAIIGKKVGMTQIFDEKGLVVPVTVIEAGPCVVPLNFGFLRHRILYTHYRKPGI